MRVLVLGGGGREHALVWKLAQSQAMTALYAMPGSDAIAALATCLPGDANDPDTVLAAVTHDRIDLVVIGPEAPLVAGVSDHLRTHGIAVFGPSQAAAQLESSKAFTKAVCEKADIPTGRAVQVEDVAKATAAISEFGAPVVVKADGLAAGKGVIIADSEDDARAAAQTLLDSYGPPLLIEEFLIGDEVSVFAVADGKTVIPLSSAEDHKAAHDGDTGPNTGGMGAFSPSPLIPADMMAHLMATVFQPTVDAMAADGMPFTGVLYAGLMMTQDGPKLLEFNTRFGDPECQILMMRMTSDLLPVLHAAATCTLDRCPPPTWSDDWAATIVYAANGYPGSYSKGDIIAGIDTAEAAGSVVFQAGTQHKEGRVTAHGGRVLNVSATGGSRAQALGTAYDAISQIDWPGGFFRRDIGQRTYKTR